MAPQRQKLKLRVHKKNSCHPQTVKTYTRRVKQLSTSAVVNQPTTSLHVETITLNQQSSSAWYVFEFT